MPRRSSSSLAAPGWAVPSPEWNRPPGSRIDRQRRGGNLQRKGNKVGELGKVLEGLNGSEDRNSVVFCDAPLMLAIDQAPQLSIAMPCSVFGTFYRALYGPIV